MPPSRSFLANALFRSVNNQPGAGPGWFGGLLGNHHDFSGNFGGQHSMQPHPVPPTTAPAAPAAAPSPFQNFTIGNRPLGLPLNFGS